MALHTIPVSVCVSQQRYLPPVLTRDNNDYDVDLDLQQDVFWLWNGCFLFAVVSSVH